MRVLVRLSACIVVVICGCNDSSGGSQPPSIASTQQNVCDQVAAVACYNWYRCCSEGEIERNLGVTDPRTGAQCLEDVNRMCLRKLAGVNYSSEQGRVTFENTRMDSCLKALLVPEESCTTVDQMLPWASACMEAAWVGMVGVGGECTYSYECADETVNYCAPNRTCTPRPTAGQPCDTGCATGLYCNLGKCAAQLGVGGPCTVSTQCVKDLFCDLSQPAPVCTPLRQPGEACVGNDSCKYKSCLPGTCAGTATACYLNSQCYGRCANNGANCTIDAQCGVGHCSIATTMLCNYPTDCSTAQGTCVFPYTCMPPTCQGNVVCADVTMQIDYCTDTLSSLPLPH